MALARRLPFPLSQRLSDVSSALFNKQGREYDVAIGGIPFMLATYSELPQGIETIPIRKEQFDTEDPGEQSLTGWWRRSQSSFHEGAGNLYQENSAQNVDSLGFFDSSGVDVFTPGRLTLLKRMKSAAVTGGNYSRVRSHSGGYSAVDDGALHDSPAASGTFASLHAPAGKTIVDGLITGDFFYDVASDGTLYEGQTSDPGSATTWPLGSAATRLGWGKHRLWVIGGRNIWQPDLSATGGTAQTPIFTNPNKGWTYTAMAEGMSAMYFAGHDGNQSSIQAVTLDANGGLPTLSGAQVSAAMPQGELVQELGVIAGQFLGIGTNKGFRVGVMAPDGSVTYGPLIIEPEGITSCTAVGAQGRFFLVGFATASGNALAYRVDTGTPLQQDGVFPYAKDFDCEFPGSVTSIAIGDTIVATASDGLVYYQSDTEFVPQGFLETGRIRYRTTERKFFRFLSVEIEPLRGLIAIDFIKEGGSVLPVGTVSRQGEVSSENYAIRGEAQRYGSVRFTLSPQGSEAPIIHSYQVQALPAVGPQRLITLPLLCFDREQARSGQIYGGDGYARDRLEALMLLEDASEELIYQDFGTLLGAETVIIESLRFQQTSPPRGPKGPGGIILVQLRTVGR